MLLNSVPCSFNLYSHNLSSVPSLKELQNLGLWCIEWKVMDGCPYQCHYKHKCFFFISVHAFDTSFLLVCDIDHQWIKILLMISKVHCLWSLIEYKVWGGSIHHLCFVYLVSSSFSVVISSFAGFAPFRRESFYLP